MGILGNLFGKKEEPIQSYADFWNWFQKHEKQFHSLVKNGTKVQDGFLNKIGPKLEQIKEGFFFLTGMYDDTTVELILTADGNTNTIVFIEELVAGAPVMNGWKITALKPAEDIENTKIEMAGYQFSSGNLHFYANDYPDFPDEIDITIVHDDYTEENKTAVINGSYIFLDNYLGELDVVNNIDTVNFIGPADAQKELVPIEKLKHYLIWRQKEFIEKYQGARYNTEEDGHAILEATLQSGLPLIATINTDILNWDSKASHPWVSIMTMKYDGKDNNGLPNPEDYAKLGAIEDELLAELSDANGNLFIGHQSAENERSIYMASKDFRQPSKVFYTIQQKYADQYEIEYEIYKDKYWQSFQRFVQE